MGGSQSNEAVPAPPTGQRVVEAKIAQSKKTGSLNLSNQDIKTNSWVWVSIGSPDLSTKLKVLDVSGNVMKSLPSQVSGLPVLKILYANGCSLQRSPNMIPSTRLKQVYMNHNDLEETTLNPLPNSVSKLDLGFNHFTRFPPVLSLLVNLEEINLSGNRLESIEGIGNLVNLVLVTLDDNRLQELSLDFTGLVKIKKLSIRNNNLHAKAVTREGQSIPEGLFITTALENLDLQGNIQLKKTEILAFNGIETFLERRRANKEKGISGGAMTDLGLFGLE
jgi:Leucine-rich repeat (LRR) protein